MKAQSPQKESSGANTKKKHHGNPQNLMPPWKPGQSGNPLGRPKGKSITKIMFEVLAELDPETKRLVAEKAARAYIEQSLTNSSFANIVLDRTEGSVVQQHEISGLEDLPQLIAEGRKRAGLKEK